MAFIWILFLSAEAWDTGIAPPKISSFGIMRPTVVYEAVDLVEADIGEMALPASDPTVPVVAEPTIPVDASVMRRSDEGFCDFGCKEWGTTCKETTQVCRQMETQCIGGWLQTCDDFERVCTGGWEPVCRSSTTVCAIFAPFPFSFLCIGGGQLVCHEEELVCKGFSDVCRATSVVCQGWGTVCTGAVETFCAVTETVCLVADKTCDIVAETAVNFVECIASTPIIGCSEAPVKNLPECFARSAGPSVSDGWEAGCTLPALEIGVTFGGEDPDEASFFITAGPLEYNTEVLAAEWRKLPVKDYLSMRASTAFRFIEAARVVFSPKPEFSITLPGIAWEFDSSIALRAEHSIDPCADRDDGCRVVLNKGRTAVFQRAFAAGPVPIFVEVNAEVYVSVIPVLTGSIGLEFKFFLDEPLRIFNSIVLDVASPQATMQSIRNFLNPREVAREFARLMRVELTGDISATATLSTCLGLKLGFHVNEIGFEVDIPVCLVGELAVTATAGVSNTEPTGFAELAVTATFKLAPLDANFVLSLPDVGAVVDTACGLVDTFQAQSPVKELTECIPIVQCFTGVVTDVCEGVGEHLSLDLTLELGALRVMDEKVFWQREFTLSTRDGDEVAEYDRATRTVPAGGFEQKSTESIPLQIGRADNLGTNDQFSAAAWVRLNTAPRVSMDGNGQYIYMNKVELHDQVGNYGGSCTCPNGETFWAGDNVDDCASLACDGGISGTCNREKGPWSGRKVTCGAKTPANKYYMGTVGGTCKYSDIITSKSECIAAHRALGLTANMIWEGAETQIPVGCITRQGNSHDLHWNTASYGEGRADLTPICKKISEATIFGTLDTGADQLSLAVRDGFYYMGFGTHNECKTETSNTPDEFEHIAFTYWEGHMAIYLNGELVKACHDRLSYGDRRYIRAFQATGCPNPRPSFAQVTWWKHRTALFDAFKDMKTLCQLTKDNHASQAQKDTCCGPNMHCVPASCSLQTGFQDVQREVEYVVVQTGDCESNGVQYIKTREECIRAAAEVGVEHREGNASGNRQKYCGTWGEMSFLHFNEQTSGNLNGFPILQKAGSDVTGGFRKTYQICKRFTTTGKVYVGRGPTGVFDGTIEHARTWTRALSASDIANAAGLTSPELHHGCRVTLYDEDNSQGSSSTYDIGEYNEIWMNDAVTSMEVSYGCKATLFEHRLSQTDGYKVSFDGGVYSTQLLNAYGVADNSASSLTVRWTGDFRDAEVCAVTFPVNQGSTPQERCSAGGNCCYDAETGTCASCQGVDMCSAGQQVRPGKTSRDKCQALDGCCFTPADDSCAICRGRQAALTTRGLKTLPLNPIQAPICTTESSTHVLSNGKYNPRCCELPRTNCDNCSCGRTECCLPDVIATNPPATTGACSVESGFDYPGNDLERVAGVSSSEDCALLCGSRADCTSWTYGKDAKHWSYRYCWLKSGVRVNRKALVHTDSGVPCVSAAPASVGCSPPSTFQSGGYHCNGACLNGNTGYDDLTTAWARCSELSACAYIMKWPTGKFYVRRASDTFDSDMALEHVEYTCTGSSGLEVLGSCTAQLGTDCQPSGSWLGTGNNVQECHALCPNGFVHATHGDSNCKCLTGATPRECTQTSDHRFGLCVYVPAGTECMNEDTKYSPIDDLPGEGRSVEADASACQARCVATAGCAYFSFWENGGCHLSSASAVPTAETGVKSGAGLCPGCPKISHDGRCGPLFGDSVCSTKYHDWAKYCNEENGWCGDTDAHKNAQPSTKYDESSIPASCKGVSGSSDRFIEHNVNYGGADIQVIMNVVRSQDCGELCGVEPLCKSWTYNTDNKKCFLKDQVKPNRSANNVAESGLPFASSKTKAPEKYPVCVAGDPATQALADGSYNPACCGFSRTFCDECGCGRSECCAKGAGKPVTCLANDPATQVLLDGSYNPNCCEKPRTHCDHCSCGRNECCTA